MDKMEKEWLQEWKEKNKGTINRIRKRLINENPFTSHQGIEKMLDKILLDPPADGPMKDENGIDLVYFEDYGDWFEDNFVYEMDDGEQQDSRKRYAHLYEKLTKTLSRMKNGKLVKMYFGVGTKKHSYLEIAKKIKKSEAYVYWLLKKTLSILKDSLEKS